MLQTVILYPGCLVLYRFPEYELAAKILLEELGYTVTNLPEALCCGSFLEGISSKWSNYTAYNLAMAEKIGAPMITLCGGCTNVFNRFKQNFETQSKFRTEIVKDLDQTGLSLSKPPQVKHLIQLLWEHREDLKAKIKHHIPLKVNAVYPCQVYRPGKVMQFDDPLHPKTLAELLSLTGATVIHYEGEARCCGSSLYMAEPELALKMGQKRTDEMIASGANLGIAACGNCYLLLSRLQPKYRHAPFFPFLFLPQLIGLAVGIESKNLGITNRDLRRLQSFGFDK